MNTAECLSHIAETGDDAYWMLRETDKKYEKRFENLANGLHSLLLDIRKEFPDAQYYTGSGGFNLLLGNSHNNDSGVTANKQLVALSSSVLFIGDGDW